MRKKKQFRQHELALHGTDALLYTRNEYWQIRIYLTDEGRYLRKSLGTKSKDIAIERGYEIWREVERDKAVGRKQFSISVEEGIDNYLEHRRTEITEVGQGGITKQRWETIRAQLKNFRAYMKLHLDDARLKDIKANDTWNYFEWRRNSSAKEPVTSTLMNEKAMINACIRYLFEQGEIGIAQLKFPKLKRIERNDIEAETFTKKEYLSFLHAARSYIKGVDELIDEEERLARNVMYKWILIAANTGMRIGEQRQLRWSDVKVYDDKDGDRLAEIRIRPETTKVRKERRFIAYKGNYFDSLSEMTGGVGFVFSVDDGETYMTDRVFRRLWAEIMELTNIDEVRKAQLVPYSLRHYFITVRYNAGVQLGKLARMCGTSLQQINKTYYHLHLEEQEEIVKLGRVSD